MTRMRNLGTHVRIGLYTFSLMLAMACGSTALAQAEREPLEPVLIDEFGRLGECEFGARIDNFFAELSNKPNFQGYIINYKSVEELPDERDSFDRERVITNHLAFRNFDRSRITLVRGGYRSELSTELWLLPPDSEPPRPSRTVPEPEIPEGTTFLFAKKSLLLYDAVTNLDEFVLASVKEREAAEQAEFERETREEQGNDSESEDKETTAGDVETEDRADDATQTDDESNVDEETAYVDERTEEEKEAERFEWANVGIARFLVTRKTAKGVIIFYADDQRYDIGKLTALIEQGRNLLTEHGPIPKGQLRIEFGGYREEPEVEFWFVPAKGKPPVPTPDERRIEDAEPPEN